MLTLKTSMHKKQTASLNKAGRFIPYQEFTKL